VPALTSAAIGLFLAVWIPGHALTLQHTIMRLSFFTLAATLAALPSLQAGTAAAPSGKAPVTPAPEPPISWLDETISPVTNPVWFEDPAIRSEIRPIYMHHRIDDGFITNGGDINLYALQLRFAVNDRLAIIATKDGYIDFNPGIGSDEEGWADIGLGLKYAVIKDDANQFILTPGLTFEIPIGDDEVFQGNGDGEFNFFVSGAKGFDKFHITANTGLRVPIDGDAESMVLHYDLMFDYRVSRWFQPFISASGITVIDDGEGPGLSTEGYDLINFGSSNANGTTQVVLGVGFRSQLAQNLSLGVAYEKAVTSPEDLFDDRLTADLIFRF